MQVVSNQEFIKKHSRIALLGYAGGFLVLMIGFYVATSTANGIDTRADYWQFYAIAPWITLAVGMILLNIGKANQMRWGGRPRPDEAIATALKPLDNRNS